MPFSYSDLIRCEKCCKWKANSKDLDWSASSGAYWSGFTLFAKSFSVREGRLYMVAMFCSKIKFWIFHSWEYDLELFIVLIVFFTLCLPAETLSSADYLCKQFGPRSGPTAWSWTQTVWHSDSLPERIFEKVNFVKSQQTTKNHEKLPSKQWVHFD